jgi:argininosuccinate lyase
MSGDPTGNKLWGGRFEASVHPEIHAFTEALSFDRRLARHDLIGTLAHARMLMETGILARADAEAALAGLAGMLRDVEAGTLAVDGPDEDVHTWIERVLRERIGDPARRVHTARSRNDQTGAALRLYVRDALVSAHEELADLQGVFLDVAREHVTTWLPGYTHLQRAQPVSLAHHLLAHFWALAADAMRMRRAYVDAGISPLGAGALAGTPHPIRPVRTAELLGFHAVYPNSMFAVADRDYVLGAAFACATLMTHLSRWAEEIVLWTSAEFGFAVLDDAIAKGSSLMPQKKNPEPAELMRGKSARVIADLNALFIVLKGLPLTYNSDLQEDKESLFDALDTSRACLRAAAPMARGLRYRPERMAAALHGGYLTATDLADCLVRKGIPFRTAHEQAGLAVREAERRSVELWDLPLAALREHAPAADEDVYASLRPEGAARARQSAGGPAPERVEEQIALARDDLDASRMWVRECEPPLIYRMHAGGALLADDAP